MVRKPDSAQAYAPSSNRDSAPLWSRDFVLVCAATFAVFVSFHLLLPTLPIYVYQIGGGAFSVGLVVGVLTTSAILLRPVVGREMDRRGRTRILVGGAAVFLLATLLYNFTDTVWTLLLLRLLHGIGWAAVTTAAITLIADIAPPTRRGEAMGYFGISSNLALATGPAAGLAIIGNQGSKDFRSLFLTTSATALVLLFLALRVREPSAHYERLTGRAAPLPTKVWLPVSTLLTLTFSWGAVATFISLYAQERRVTNIGLFFIVYATSLIIIRPFAGRISDRFGRSAAIIPGMAVGTSAIVLLVFASGLKSFLGAAVLFGLGFGSAHPAILALTVDLVPNDQRGSAMGFFTAAFDLGIGMGAVLSGLIIQLAGYPLMYAFAAGLTLTGLLNYIARRKRISHAVGAPP